MLVFRRFALPIILRILREKKATLRASQSSAFSAWVMPIVNLWLTLPTTKKQNLSLSLVDTDNERNTMFLPIFVP